MKKMDCQVENTRNRDHQFYIVKFRPSLEEIEKDKASKKYDLLITTAQRISEEIKQLEADEKEINRKLKLIYPLESSIKSKSECIKNCEHTMRSHMTGIWKEYPALNIDVPRTSGVIYLNENDAIIRPDQKRCQKRLINKGRIDMEYLHQVEEQLLSSKKINGMTSCGTQELNDLMNSMTQRTQHGSTNKKKEMKIQDKLRELNITREIYTTPEPKPADDRYYRYQEKMKERDRNEWMPHLKLRYKNYKIDLEIMKKDQKVYKTKVMRLEAKLPYVKKQLIYLRKELEDLKSKTTIIYDLVQILQKEQETCYDRYQSLSINVKEAAQKGDVDKVKQLCDTQVEGFMAQWNDHQAFRDDYQRRKLLAA